MSTDWCSVTGDAGTDGADPGLGGEPGGDPEQGGGSAGRHRPHYQQGRGQGRGQGSGAAPVRGRSVNLAE